jgi:prepilin signal peptidase PulO-like enzyme (type II secretory pathway)
LLVVLTAVAVIAVARRHTPLRAYRLVLAASAVGAVAVIPFAYVAQRYLADAFPLLAIGAIVGLFTLAPVRWHRGVLGSVVVALALWTVWANFSLSLLYQRLSTPAREQRQLTGFLGFQRSVDKLLHLDDPARVVRGDLLPAQGRRGQLFVVGDCAALYYSDGHPPSTLEPIAWTPVERTDEVGYLSLDVTFGAAAAGVVEPVVSVSEPAGGEPDVIAVEYLGGGQARFVYRGRGVPLDGPPFATRSGRVHHLTVDADRRLGTMQVRDASAVLFGTYYNAGSDEFTFGTVSGVDGVAPRFSGTINPRPANDAPLCRRLDAWAGGGA